MTAIRTHTSRMWTHKNLRGSWVYWPLGNSPYLLYLSDLGGCPGWSKMEVRWTYMGDRWSNFFFLEPATHPLKILHHNLVILNDNVRPPKTSLR